MSKRTGSQRGSRDESTREPFTRREWIVAGGSVLLAACASRSVPDTSSRPAGTGNATPAGERDVNELLQLATVPGIAIATVHGADIRRRRVWGPASDATDDVTGDTVFEAASLSKPVFTSIVMQLAEKALIDLTRPLGGDLSLPNPADDAVDAHHRHARAQPLERVAQLAQRPRRRPHG